MRNTLKSIVYRLKSDFPIVTLYLFGSRARKKPGPLSDYDFAVQLTSGLSAKQRFHIKIGLIERLTQTLKSDAVDVVLLDEAPPLLAHRILREGKILYCANTKQRVRKEFKLLTDYLDFKEDLDLYAQATLGVSNLG
jgi:predicted nucleotidyltransferase